MSKKLNNKICTLCGYQKLIKVETIKSRPASEADFGIMPEDYRRNIYKCSNCTVYNNVHSFDLDGLYSAKYNESVYSNDLLPNFNYVMDLPVNQSDNKNRVSRILSYLNSNPFNHQFPKILDVGSGLCVFLAEMIKNMRLESYCLDPSLLSVKHAMDNAGVDFPIQGSFMDFNTDVKFDLITFNKVLEHVQNPVEMLSKAKNMLNNNGLIYIELPDGDAASTKGGYINREEFFIDHFAIYTNKSIKYLVNSAGLQPKIVEHIHEPSDKYTIFSFLIKE